VGPGLPATPTAYNVAGYAIELRAEGMYREGHPASRFSGRKGVDASHTHSLKELVRVANLETTRGAAVTQDQSLRDNREVVQQWSEQSRYQRVDSAKARELVDAICHRKRGGEMADTLLVATDFAAGLNVVQALERSRFPIKVALWLYFWEHEDWRLVLTSPQRRGHAPRQAADG
jgi:hypothetical protein